MRKKEEIILPICSDDSFANKFSNFFMKKTAETRDTINSPVSETTVMEAGVLFEGQRLSQLEPLTQDEVIISS